MAGINFLGKLGLVKIAEIQGWGGFSILAARRLPQLMFVWGTFFLISTLL